MVTALTGVHRHGDGGGTTRDCPVAQPLFTRGWLFRWLSEGAITMVIAMVMAVHRPKIPEAGDLMELAQVVTASPMVVYRP